MKTKLIPLVMLCASAAFAADWTASTAENPPTGLSIGKITFDEDAEVEINRIKITNSIEVDENVTASFTQKLSSDGAISGETAMVTLSNATDAKVVGAGKDVSTLSFTGYHFSSDGGGSGKCKVLTFKDVTFNYSGSYGADKLLSNGGYLRSGQLKLDGANVNMKEGVLAIHRDSSTTSAWGTASVVLTNASTLSFAEYLPDGTKYNAVINTSGTLSDENKLISLSLKSKLDVQGSLNFTNFAITSDDSTININKGTNIGAVSLTSSTATIGNATMGVLTMNNSTIEVSDKLTFAGTTSTTNLVGVNTIKGSGSVSVTTNTTEVGSSTLNILNSNYTGNFQVNSTSGVLNIGTDGSKSDYDVKLNSSLQVNSGKVNIGSNVTIGETTRKTFHLSANGAGQPYSTIANGAKIYASAARIQKANVDGYISINENYVYATNGWNYALTFGLFSSTGLSNQIGDVILGKNAQVDVTPTSDKASYFGLYGKIEVNAGEGKLVSNQYAPLMIYENSTINLKSNDAFKVGGATSQATSDFNFYAGAKNVVLDVDVTNNIGRLVYGSAATEVELDIASGAILTLGSIALADGQSGVIKIILDDMLKEGSLVITNMDSILKSYNSSSSISFVDESGDARVLNDNLFLERIGDTTSWNVFTVATQVPEPAEWAMIFGAIALAFVAYRRKQ